jgi:hypothetical protein
VPAALGKLLVLTVAARQLYNHGPRETLENFEVHVKNRMHRSKVEYRVKNGVRMP